MLLEGFEPAIPASERSPQTYALDRATTGIDMWVNYKNKKREPVPLIKSEDRVSHTQSLAVIAARRMRGLSRRRHSSVGILRENCGARNGDKRNTLQQVGVPITIKQRQVQTVRMALKFLSFTYLYVKDFISTLYTRNRLILLVYFW